MRGVRARSHAERAASLSARDCDRAGDCFIQQAVAGLAIGLILVDPRGRIVWLNRAAEQLLGLPAAECIGRPFGKLLLDPQLLAFWHEVMCRGGNCIADVSVHWPRHVELKLNATQCLGQDGKEIGRALLFCDVTTDRNVKIELTREMAKRLLGMSACAEDSPGSIAAVTAQEMRVLQLVGRGWANEAIAEKLSVAVSTVRSHLKSVYRKLGLRSRAQAVAYAIRQHLC